MAKPSSEISKTEFKDNYNVVKILTDKIEIMEQLKTFNSKNQAVAFGIKKKAKVTLEDVLAEMCTGFKQINKEIQNIKSRLDKHDQMFKEHGWI